MSFIVHQTHSEEDDDVLPEEEEKEMEEEDAGTTMKLPALETVNQEFEHALDIRQEEFAEVERGDDKIEEERKDKKVGEKILSCICVHYILMFILCVGLILHSRHCLSGCSTVSAAELCVLLLGQ